MAAIVAAIASEMKSLLLAPAPQTMLFGTVLGWGDLGILPPFISPEHKHYFPTLIPFGG